MVFPVSGVECHPLLPPAVAFVISLFTSMGGVSGAFLLLPFQVSYLGFTSPAVSPTNLVFNVVAIPSGVCRYIREGRMAWPLAWIVVFGTLPGVLIGAIIRVRYLPDPAAFKLFAGTVLLYIGGRLLLQTAGRASRANTEQSDRERLFRERLHEDRSGGIRTVSFSLSAYEFEFSGERFRFNTTVLFGLAFAVGIVGGTYGIGGGAIIAPFCVAVLGLPVYVVAGAALLGTFVTSIAGIGWYYAVAGFAAPGAGPILPDWRLGLLFGLGGFAGMYCGARLQRFVPERWIKLLLGAVISFLAIKYVAGFFL